MTQQSPEAPASKLKVKWFGEDSVCVWDPDNPQKGPLLGWFDTTWSASRIQFLKDNWGRIPDRDIASLLSVTKNAVIGKAHRLGLTRHTTL